MLVPGRRNGSEQVGADPLLIDIIDRLRTRVARAEELRNEVITRHAEVLTNALFPHKSLQEREVAGVSFLARCGPDLLANLYQLIRPDCHDHQVIET